MVRKKVPYRRLEKHGVSHLLTRKVSAFNPERHEAVHQTHTDQPQGTVAQELQRGFMLHDRLLRPAMVVVSLGPERVDR